MSHLEGETHERTSHKSYTLRCIEALDSSLPILEKIHNRTLCLMNYRVSDGHCAGLAQACKHLEHPLFSRLLLQNNDITGD